jgi:hypothetical protein
MGHSFLKVLDLRTLHTTTPSTSEVFCAHRERQCKENLWKEFSPTRGLAEVLAQRERLVLRQIHKTRPETRIFE